VSASEGGRFASIIEKVVEQVRKLGPNTKLVKSHER
jgi:coenzyme F420-reducing hydrogenase delta subunit